VALIQRKLLITSLFHSIAVNVYISRYQFPTSPD
jgi:hypothetical protein